MKNKKLSKRFESTGFPIVEIEWLDHHTRSGWTDERDTDGTPAIMRSVGYRIKETKEAHVVAQSSASAPMMPYGDVTTILKKCVTNFRVLKK